MQLFTLDFNLQRHIRRLVDRHYRVGDISSIEGIAGGCCNESYRIGTVRAGERSSYVLRRYHPDHGEAQIHFEHSLIRHLRQKGLDLVSGLICCRSGRTWVRCSRSDNHLQEYWALFKALPGDDKYTWMENDLLESELVSAAEVLKQLHDAAGGFQPTTVGVINQAFIVDFLEGFNLELANDTGPFEIEGVRDLVKPHRRQILHVVGHCLTAKKPLSTVSQIAIHSDYHPGNLKFRDNKVVGVFDFDWSHMGYRVFDLSLALIYFAGIWEKNGHGGLDPGKFELFLRSYREALGCETQSSPLSATEVGLLPRLLATANLFVLKWELDELVANPSVQEEVTTYTNHNIRLLHWIEKNTRQIENVIASSYNSW